MLLSPREVALVKERYNACTVGQIVNIRVRITAGRTLMQINSTGSGCAFFWRFWRFFKQVSPLKRTLPSSHGVYSAGSILLWSVEIQQFSYLEAAISSKAASMPSRHCSAVMSPFITSLATLKTESAITPCWCRALHPNRRP